MIFLSWSKSTSLQVATRTKLLAEEVFDEHDLFWLSSNEIGFGSAIYSEIEAGLAQCDSGISFITPDNIYQPWLNYEAGALRTKSPQSKVWPLLLGSYDVDLLRKTPFEHLQVLLFTKKDILALLLDVADTAGLIASRDAMRARFDALWDAYRTDVERILGLDRASDLMEPDEARLYFMQHWNVACDSGSVILVPSHFETYDLYQFLLENAKERLWIFGRKNRKLGNRDNIDYMRDLGKRIQANGLDLRLMYFDPKTPDFSPDVLQRKRNFTGALSASVDDMLDLFDEAGIDPVGKVRFYRFLRNEAIMIMDNLVFFTNVRYDLKGKPEHLTDGPFYFCDVNNGVGQAYRQVFLDAWEKALPYEE